MTTETKTPLTDNASKFPVQVYQHSNGTIMTVHEDFARALEHRNAELAKRVGELERKLADSYHKRDQAAQDSITASFKTMEEFDKLRADRDRLAAQLAAATVHCVDREYPEHGYLVEWRDGRHWVSPKDGGSFVWNGDPVFNAIHCAKLCAQLAEAQADSRRVDWLEARANVKLWEQCRAIERAANAMEAALENLRSRSFCRCFPTIKCAKCRAGEALAAFAALRKEEGQ